MIHDDLLTYEQVIEILPGRTHRSTLHRWCLRGVRGVKLVTVLVGGRRYVAKKDLAAFIEATTAAGNAGVTTTQSGQTRAEAIRAAEAELDALEFPKTRATPT